MNAKLIPSDPSSVTSIRQITSNITTLSAPFARFGRFYIGGRATLVRLPSKKLAVFSPVALTDEVRKTIDALSSDVEGDRSTKVAYIAALDYEHHIFLGPWKKEFPDAKVLGVEGLPEKRAKMGYEDVKFFKVFTKKEEEDLENSVREGTKGQPRVDAEFDESFDVEYVPGHSNKELVFNYKRDRTLIEGDLFFNLPAFEQYSKSDQNPQKGIWNKIFNGLQGTSGNTLNWQRRFIWYACTADRAALNSSIGRIQKWDFDRVVPCHGEVIESGGKSIFEQVFAWNLAALKKN